ncbi:MAG TPA: hypothetical protein VFY06_05165 [Verrucomicrobiae bacterium]|nr:hypothetical protein [Verrucomicrobiae bacterium]
MKTKVILSIVVGLLIISLAAGAYWWWSRPQVITFNDGTKLTLLGVEYGKRHAVPGGKPLPGSARIVRAAGPQLVPGPPNGNGSFSTLNDTLIVWVRTKYHSPTSQPGQPRQYRGFQLSVSDKDGTAFGFGFSPNMSDRPQGDEILPILFDAFPRRAGKLTLRAREDYSGGEKTSDDEFVISNPAAKMSFPKWTPEPLPDRETNGDWTMTLTRLVAGVNLPSQTNSDNPDAARNKGVQLTFHAERAGKPVTSWQLASVEITDATGNRTGINSWAKGASPVQWNGDEGTFTYPNGLWPDEPAWKLRLEMTQTAGFSRDEQWTVQNIPVVPGGQQMLNAMAGMPDISMRGGVMVRNNLPAPTPCAETDLGGHHIKVFPAVQFTNNVRMRNLPANFAPPQTALSIQIQPALIENGMMLRNGPNGSQMADDRLHLTLAQVTDGQSGEIQAYSSGVNTSFMDATSTATYRFMLRDLAGVTNISATIALHKNRVFEFTVKPQKARAGQP